MAKSRARKSIALNPTKGTHREEALPLSRLHGATAKPRKKNASKGLSLWSGPGLWFDDGKASEALVERVTVRVVVEEAVPFGVRDAGEKLQVASAGRPEHANVTGWLKPFCGETVIV